MLSNDNSSVSSRKHIKQEYDKNQLYFDDDTVPMSSDNCNIATSSSTLSYDSAGNAHNEIEIYNVNDDVIYNVLLPKYKCIGTETPASISKQVLGVLFDSGATKTMIKRSVLPRGVKPRKLIASKVMKTLAGTLAATETVTLRDIRLPEFDKNRRIEE